MPTPSAAETGRPSIRWMSVVGVSLSNLIELYDWSVFATFSTYFAAQIFPSTDEGLALLSTLLAYSVSFFLRPLGGLLIGRFADTRGRRSALLLSVTLMAGGSLGIATLPTYAVAGVLAPILLVLMRVAQGLALGGETAAAATYLTEIAPNDRRGRYGAAFYVSSGAATLLAALVGLALVNQLDSPEMTVWGWRVPFAIGFLLGVITLLLRFTLRETELFGRTRPSVQPGRYSVRHVVRHHSWKGLMVLGVSAGGTVAYYTVFSALAPFAISRRGAEGSTVFVALLVGTVLFTLLLYPFGVLLTGSVEGGSCCCSRC